MYEKEDSNKNISQKHNNISEEEFPDAEFESVLLETMVLFNKKRDTEIDIIHQQVQDYLFLEFLPHHSTPLDELGGHEQLFSMVFPTLFPYRVADFYSGRQRSVKLKKYIQHLLKYYDNCFGQHIYFYYFTFNLQMQNQVQDTTQYYVNKSNQ